MLSSRIVQSGAVNVIALFERELEAAMTKIQSYAVDAIAFYTQQLGFYPQTYLIILAGWDKGSGGYPVDSGVVALHGVNEFETQSTAYWKWITAHEIAHMYWGYHVFDGKMNAVTKLGWLTIGLGIYMDQWYSDARGLNVPILEDAVKSYLNLNTAAENKSFDLREEQVAKLDFDYNTVIHHGKAFYLIKRIEEALQTDRFRIIYKKMLESFAGKQITYDRMLEFIYEQTGLKLSIDVE